MGDPERDERPTVPARPASGERPEREAVGHAPTAFDPGEDRFEARGELGRGGMGRVDDAFDRALGRPVAIKHMLSAQGVDLARFEREARITARLEHPGIVPIHDAGRGPDGTPYYVMRRVDGQPLAELVTGKRLRERLALIPNLLAACDAAAFAHAREIVHRDIKPTNILVGPFGETLLIDWGLARELGEKDGASAAIPASDPRLTRAGTVAGTPGFMAPEQARGETVDLRADVWALGATLFYVLAGEAPYGERSATEMVNMAGSDRPPDWSRIPEQVAPDLRAIVMKAMALDPRARYSDAAALAADLRRFVTGNLVGAYEYGTLARIGRFVRRHRAAVAVASVSAVVLAAVAALSVRRVVEERDVANAARALAEQRQREAIDNAEVQLLQRAKESIERDPTAAVIMLRGLRPDSTRWPQAATIAQAAALRGIPFGYTGAVADHVEFSPDGTRLAVISPAGAIRVCTLADHTCQPLVDFRRRASIGWRDRDHLVAASDDQLVDYDIDAGTRRSRSIAAGALDVRIGKTGGLFLAYPDRIDVLDSFEAMPHPFLPTDAISVDHPADLFVSQSPGVEVWTASGGHWVLAPGRKAANLVSNDAVISLGDDIAAWRITPTGPEAIGHWKIDRPTYAVADRSGLFISTTRGVLRATSHGAFTILPNVQTIMTTTSDGRTVFIAADDGAIHVYDDGTAWQIGRRGVRYHAITASADGRYLAGIAENGTLLVWDLAAIRPRIHTVASGTVVGDVLRDRLIMTNNLDVFTQDIATDQPLETLYGTHAPVQLPWVDPTGTMISVTEMLPGEGVRTGLLVFDARTFAPLGKISQGEPVQFSACDQGLLFGHRDGTVELWSNTHGFEKKVLAHLDPHPELVVTAGDRVFASYGKQLVRLDLPTQSSLRFTLPAPIDELVQTTGTVYALADGRVWRWDGRWPPALLPIPGRVIHLYASPHGAIVRTSTTLLVQTDPPAVISTDGDAMPSNAGIDFDGASTWIAVAAGTQKVLLADLASRLSFAVPVPGATHAVLVADRRLFVQIVGGRILEWDLDVPAEPAALRHWLETVTNAKGLPESDAVLWP